MRESGWLDTTLQAPERRWASGRRTRSGACTQVSFAPEPHLPADVLSIMADPELLQQLRTAFAAIATREVPNEELALLAHSVRDAILELNRLSHDDLTPEQWKLCSDMEHRIRETAKGKLSLQPLPALAVRALAAFGWEV